MNHTFDGRTFLRLLVALRYTAIAAQSVTVLAVSRWLDLALPIGALSILIGTMLIFNVASHAVLARGRGVSNRVVVLELGFDIVALTAILFFTGGPTNPFVSLYLLPIALGALVLPRSLVAFVGALAACAYTALLLRHVPLPHVHGVADFDLHVTGMWVNFLVSAVLLVGFLVHFITLVERERARVARAREGALRDEALLGLGFLAAGTAHELNTPLGTMRLLVDEWSAHYPQLGSAAAQAAHASTIAVPARDVELMRTQIDRLSAHVRTLAATAKRVSLENGAAPEGAAAFVTGTVREWHALRPSVDVELSVGELAKDRVLAVDPTLPQAIANLLNNAADASVANGVQSIRVEACDGHDRLNLRILDRGPGLTNSSRGAGLGIGLLISNATVERFGGRVRRFERAGGGSVTEVELPFLGVAA